MARIFVPAARAAVDIQGADADALISAGAHLQRFACVIGEFRGNHYDVPNGIVIDPKDILLRAGFRKVAEGMREKVWINSRFLGRFFDPSNYTCTAGEAIPGQRNKSAVEEARRGEEATRHARMSAAVSCVLLAEQTTTAADKAAALKRCEWKGGWLVPKWNRTRAT